MDQIYIFSLESHPDVYIGIKTKTEITQQESTYTLPAKRLRLPS